jgi:sugar phosphate isomerase/epimerase
MNLSCADYSFPLLSDELAWRLIAALGFERVDIGFWGGHTRIRPEDVRGDAEAAGGRLRADLDAHGLAVADLFLIPDPDYAKMAVDNPDAEERARGRELFGEMLGFATALGAPGLTLVPGVEFEGVPHDDSLRRAAEELAARIEIAAAAGLRVSIEPHIGSIVETPAETLRLLELTPGLEVTLDCSHYTMQGFDQDELDPLLGRVRHAHARAARPERLQVGMKENAIDFGRLVDRLRAVGYDGAVATEYLWIDQARCDECDTLSETILMRDLLRERIEGAAAA